MHSGTEQCQTYWGKNEDSKYIVHLAHENKKQKVQYVYNVNVPLIPVEVVICWKHNAMNAFQPSAKQNIGNSFFLVLNDITKQSNTQ